MWIECVITEGLNAYTLFLVRNIDAHILSPKDGKTPFDVKCKDDEADQMVFCHLNEKL